MQCCLAPVTLFHVCIMLLWACIIMCQICITLYSASVLWFNVEKKTQTCSLTVPSLSLLAHVYIIYRSVKHFDLHLYENVPDSSTWTRLVFMTCSAIHTCQWSGPHTQSSDCETVCDNVKKTHVHLTLTLFRFNKAIRVEMELYLITVMHSLFRPL